MPKSLRSLILAAYQANPHATRLQIAKACGLAAPTNLFDDQLVKVQSDLRRRSHSGPVPCRKFTKGTMIMEDYWQQCAAPCSAAYEEGAKQ